MPLGNFLGKSGIGPVSQTIKKGIYMSSPAMVDPVVGNDQELEDEEASSEYTMIFVRVRDAHGQFAKNKLEYPDAKDEAHKNDAPKVFDLKVQGYDEWGDPTMPVYRVPSCPEIMDAINNDKTYVPGKEKKILTNGRLVQVREQIANRFPLYIGTPNISDSAEVIYDRVVQIDQQREKGDAILGRKRKPFAEYFFHPNRGDNDKQLFELYLEGMRLKDPDKYAAKMEQLKIKKETSV